MDRVRLNRLPALPASVSELLRMAPDDQGYFDGVLHVCEADPGLASELIRLSRSVAIATHSPAPSVRQALLLVGPKPAVAHLIGGAFVQVFVPHAPVVRELWERSVWTAAAAARLASDVGGVDPHVAQATALLHDLGRFAMSCTDQQAYAALVARGGDAGAQLAHEREVFGEDHTVLGARLAAIWTFPHLFRFVIRHHHDKKLEGAADVVAYTRIVALADVLHDVDASDPASCARAARRAVAAGLPFEADDMPVLRDRIEHASRSDVERLGLSPVAAS